jgi:hypothetical protein
MSKEDLLRFANDQKPADFAAEFKTQIGVAVAQKLTAPKEAPAELGDEGED